MQLKLIAAVVGIVAVVGGGYFILQNMGGTGGNGLNAENEEMTEESGAFSGTFAELMGRGGSYRCDIGANTEAGVTGGVFYVSGSDVRTDTTSMVNGASVNGSMIMAGDFVYTWSDSAPYGMKVKVNPAEVSTSDAPGTSGQVFAQDVSYSWDCDPWTRDASIFTPPASVEFMDLEAMGAGAGSMPPIPSY